MTSRRDTVLEASLEALRLHSERGTEANLKEEGGRVDVFRAIADLNVVLLFKQLEGLLGAYMPNPNPGILVTTQRSLAIQRYTAAHELGHHYMRHQVSLDDDAIIHRSPFANASYNPQELAADTFAAVFLAPEWLLNYQAHQQEWTAADLRRPETLYQLSLRLGISYEATCRMLIHYGFGQRNSLNEMLKIPPRTIKEGLLGAYQPPNFHCNVWVLTERDAETVVYGEPEDIFIVRLKEHSGAGYIWNIEQVKAAGFSVVGDQRLIPDTDDIGGAVERILTATSHTASLGTLQLEEVRPWDHDDAITRLSFAYDVRGRERGLARAWRERVVAA